MNTYTNMKFQNDNGTLTDFCKIRVIGFSKKVENNSTLHFDDKDYGEKR